jgi:hypothetical protein
MTASEQADALLRALPHTVVELDAEFRVVYHNRDDTRFSPGVSILEQLPVSLVEPARRAFQEIVLDGRPRIIEGEARGNDRTTLQQPGADVGTAASDVQGRV